MAIQRELRYGTSEELESFVGGPHELVHDTTRNTVEVHDGNGNSNKMATTDSVEIVDASLTDHKNKLVNSWSDTLSTELYPSEKLVKDTIDDIVVSDVTNLQVKCNYLAKSNDYLAVNLDWIFADTLANTAFKVVLPATPTVGDVVIVHDAVGGFGTNNLTVERNGSTIMGLAEDMTLSTNNETAEFMYSGSDWRLI